MANKSVLEEALLEAQALEEAVKTNAKEILSSTMKEEIEELVKESLNEEEIDFNLEDSEEEVQDVPDLEQDFEDEDDFLEDEDDFDKEPLDLRGASDDEVLKVFKLMGSDDGVIVTQDDDIVDIKDEETGVEYKVELSENTMNEGKRKPKNWQGYKDKEDESLGMRTGKEVNEVEDDELELDEFHQGMKARREDSYGDWGKRGEEDRGISLEEEDDDEPIYEIELEDDEHQGDYDREHESMGMRLGKGHDDQSLSYGEWGHRTGDEKRGWGHDKFSEAEDAEASKEEEKEEETNEASRSLGFGSKKGRGYRKAFTNNRNLTFKEGRRRQKPRISESQKKYNKLVEYTKSQDNLVDKLISENKNIKSKVGEYKNALGDFRNKINEVAVFNSNLAYATKLFTEHTTSKEEKINIMRRFDEVETLNESKNLFKRLTSELRTKTNSLSESVKKKITRSPYKGSTNLIESKIYESPQITRIKDMMTKIK